MKGRIMAWAALVALGAAAAEGDAIKETLDAFVDTGCIAGVVSVVSDADYRVRTDCAGWADLERRVPITDRTLFAIFSMTKTFTGVAVLCGVDEGKLAMDDPVAKFLPEFAHVKKADGTAPKRPIAIRDLLCHVAGFRGGEHVVNRSRPLRDVARRLAATPLAAEPGETFSYGNSWIGAAAACLEVATGEPYEAYLKRKVLDPLGMVDTTFWPDAEQRRRLVKAYTSDGYPARPADDACVPQLVFPKAARVYPAAAGGLFSTPADMIRFSQMLAHHGEWKGRAILRRATFDGVFAVKQTPSGVAQPYTVGAWIWGDWIGHEGAMRTDQRANLKTGHSRVFFIQTENKAGPAFFQLKAVWQDACDRVQGTKKTVFGT